MTVILTADHPVGATFAAIAGGPTPELLLSLDVLRAQYETLSATLPGTTLYFAVKANPHPDVLAALRGVGCSFSIEGPAEVASARAAGALPAQLLSANPIQSRVAIRAEYAAGVRLFVADSLDEAAKLADDAPGSSVLGRLAMTSDGNGLPLGGKFGADTAALVSLLDRLPAMGLRPAGVGFHVGHPHAEPGRWRAPIRAAADIFARLRALGHRPWLLDLGGGFPPHGVREGAPLASYGVEIRRALSESFGHFPPRTIAQPGRALVGDAGTLVTTVIGVAQRGGERWVYLDAGVFNGLTEAIGDAFHDRLSTTAAPSASAPAVLAGPTSDAADVLSHRVMLPSALQAGDRVFIRTAGAYTTAHATSYNAMDPIPTRIVDQLP